MLRRIRQLLAIGSTLLLLAILVLRFRSAWLGGCDELIHWSPSGTFAAFVYKGDLYVEQYDLPEKTAWSLAHWPKGPGDSFDAEMELAHPHAVFPGIVWSPWTHFPAAGDYQITILAITFLIVALALLPTLEFGLLLRRGLRQRRRQDASCCRRCGYDLRAHQPGGRCPECGTTIPRASEAQA